MPAKYFYQVQVPCLIIPSDIPLYLTQRQIQRHSGLTVDSDPADDGWHFVLAPRTASIALDQGEVFGLTEPAKAGLSGKLSVCEVCAGISPAHPAHKEIRPFKAIDGQTDEVFEQVTGISRGAFMQYLRQLEQRPLRSGRRQRFVLEDGLYLCCLKTQGQYTYTQLAKAYGCSVTQVYSAVQWTKRQLGLSVTSCGYDRC